MAIFPTEGEPGMTWADWKKLPVKSHDGRQAHAIQFDDGTVFDLCNGWRERTKDGWRRIVDHRVDGTSWAEAAFVDDVDPAQREPWNIGMMTPEHRNDACTMTPEQYVAKYAGEYVD